VTTLDERGDGSAVWAPRRLVGTEEAVVDAIRLWHGYRDTLRATPPPPDPRLPARRAKQLEGHTEAPGAVAWSPDGAVVYAVAADDGVLAWDAATGERAPTDFEVPEGR
jgi:WD40 repeat protein